MGPKPSIALEREEIITAEESCFSPRRKIPCNRASIPVTRSLRKSYPVLHPEWTVD